MIPWQKISEFEFNSTTESLAGHLLIPNNSVLPLGGAAESRYNSITILYIPDESRVLDSEWISSLKVQSSTDLFRLCHQAFDKLYEVATEMKGNFEKLLAKKEPYTDK